MCNHFYVRITILFLKSKCCRKLFFRECRSSSPRNLSTRSVFSPTNRDCPCCKTSGCPFSREANAELDLQRAQVKWESQAFDNLRYLVRTIRTPRNGSLHFEPTMCVRGERILQDLYSTGLVYAFSLQSSFLGVQQIPRYALLTALHANISRTKPPRSTVASDHNQESELLANRMKDLDRLATMKQENEALVKDQDRLRRESRSRVVLNGAVRSP